MVPRLEPRISAWESIILTTKLILILIWFDRNVSLLATEDLFYFILSFFFLLNLLLQTLMEFTEIWKKQTNYITHLFGLNLLPFAISEQFKRNPVKMMYNIKKSKSYSKNINNGENAQIFLGKNLVKKNFFSLATINSLQIWVGHYSSYTRVSSVTKLLMINYSWVTKLFLEENII